MTTLHEARDELIDALRTANLRATDTPGGMDPPYVAVLGDGIDLSHIIRGQTPARFRAACIAGKADASGSVADLDALKLDVLVVLRALPGWALGEVRGDGIRTYGGSDLLTADVTASRMIDIS